MEVPFKVKHLEEKYELGKLEFPGGGGEGVQTKKNMREYGYFLEVQNYYLLFQNKHLNN